MENVMSDAREQADQTLLEFQQLLNRALVIVVDAPHWSYVGEPRYARLTIDGDEATLIWPEIESDGYGWSGIEPRSVTFESRLLFVGKAELAIWKQDKRAEYDAKQRLNAADAAAARERQERATLAALKAKYDE